MTLQAQTGWFACRRCQGLISSHVSGDAIWSCLDGAMHDFAFGAQYRAVWSEFPENVQPGWGTCVRCARLAFRHIQGRCHDGAPHEFAEGAPDLGVPVGPGFEGTEPGWWSCLTCQCLCDIKNPERRCFAGGVHDFTNTWEYAVPVVGSGLQGWWQWCRRCDGLVLSSTSRCRDGNTHDPGGADTYGLPYGVVPEGSQPGWRACVKCGMLVFAGGPASACYAGDVHDLSGALDYSVALGPAPSGAIPGWRHCAKCQTLSFAPFSTGGCPAGGEHDYRESAEYSVFPEWLDEGQPGWRRCGRCDAMTFAQLSHGLCPDGQPHDVSASGAYRVPMGDISTGTESSWRRCSSCQVLVHGPGVCVGGWPHDVVDSPHHGVPLEPPPEGAERGWRRCRHCQELALETEAGGLCTGGGAHEFAGSPAYSVPVETPAPAEVVAPTGEVTAPTGEVVPATPTRPRLKIAESATAIAVDGTGFDAAGAVKLGFVAGAASVKADLVADDHGAFQHVVSEVGASAGPVSVVARDANDVATGRLRSFAPAALAPPVEPLSGE
jgi:hypothetical protein